MSKNEEGCPESERPSASRSAHGADGERRVCGSATIRGVRAFQQDLAGRAPRVGGRFYGQLRRELGEVFHELVRQKECRIEQGHLLADHVHVLIHVDTPEDRVAFVQSGATSWSAHKAPTTSDLFRISAVACLPVALLAGAVQDSHRRDPARDLDFPLSSAEYCLSDASLQLDGSVTALRACDGTGKALPFALGIDGIGDGGGKHSVALGAARYYKSCIWVTVDSQDTLLAAPQV